ncbi:MAG TPA: OmpH family outer membrane protein [Bdellovibrionota bacterium]|nr:OmpH family outer membrane protein [Bdellovibrionota bacterium]
MRFIRSIPLLLILTLGAAPAMAEEMKIGTVDMQKALQSVDAGKKAKAALEKEFNAKKKEVQTEEQSIRKAGEELEKQSLVMNDEAKNKKRGELQARIMKLQQSTAQSQAELQEKERNLTKPIIDKLRAIIADMAKSKGYAVVLEKNENTVLFSHEKDDLTQAVIESFNKQNKS